MEEINYWFGWRLMLIDKICYLVQQVVSLVQEGVLQSLYQVLFVSRDRQTLQQRESVESLLS